MSATKHSEDLVKLEESLKAFEDFILKENITMADLAPAYCSNWMDIERYDGNTYAWKLNRSRQSTLLRLHLDVASASYCAPSPECTNILNNVSQRARIIFGIVGSNAGDVWHSHTYRTAHFGTVRLMKFWGTIVEAKDVVR